MSRRKAAKKGAASPRKNARSGAETPSSSAGRVPPPDASATAAPAPKKSFTVPDALAAEIDALVGHYPEPRSAAVMVLHALQEHFGWLEPAALEWAATRLGLEPLHLYELVTFYPMFHQQPVGRFHLRVCRTLSCALAGSQALHRHLCEKLGLDPEAPGVQTTADGRFSVEFVECLASCDTAPVMMCNDELIERATPDRADQLLREKQS
jgi:NADH-quinone oxidoreductase subunit E